MNDSCDRTCIQFLADVVNKRPDIGASSALDFEFAFGGLKRNKLQRMNRHLPNWNVNGFTTLNVGFLNDTETPIDSP